MKLKLKLADDSKIVNLDGDSTIKQLLDLIMDPVDEVRFGFPPEKLDLSSKDSKLADCGVRNGDQLAVKVKVMDTMEEGQTTNQGDYVDNVDITSDPQTVECGEGQYLKLRVMEDDNSCMFNAVGYDIMRTTNVMFELRTIISETIMNDPINYSDAILGRPRKEYCDWIRKETSWGGAIELAILSKHFEVTIICFDIKTLQQHKFNPGMSSFIIVAYSGIHYDAVSLSPLPTDTTDAASLDTTVFQADDIGMQVLNSLDLLGSKLQNSNYYTDTSNFTLKCNKCGTSLKGEKDALEHAKSTGHADFGEYS